MGSDFINDAALPLTYAAQEEQCKWLESEQDKILKQNRRAIIITIDEPTDEYQARSEIKGQRFELVHHKQLKGRPR